MYDKLQIKLLQNINNCLYQKLDVQIDAIEQANIEFSKDGKFMAIFYIEDSILDFYEIIDQNIENALEALQQKKPTHQFLKKDFNEMNFNKIHFDKRYFALWSRENICIIDMEA